MWNIISTVVQIITEKQFRVTDKEENTPHAVIWTWVILNQLKYFIFLFRDVTINREPVDNQFKHVTIQISWDAKRIMIQLVEGVYMNNVWGELTVFRMLLALEAIFSFHLVSV